VKTAIMKFINKTMIGCFLVLITSAELSAATKITHACLNNHAFKKDSIPNNPTDIRPLLIGEVIPAVILPDAKGNMFNLNEAVAKNLLF